jgi:ell wall binding domain 2 (CWB2)
MSPPVPSPARLTVLLGIALLTAALAGCGRSGTPGTPGPSMGAKGDESAAATALGFPVFATKNTTRVGGGDPVADAAAVARAVYPAATPGTRPRAVTLVDGRDWRAALAASVLMSPPVRAPVLLGAGGDLPGATAAALATLRPRGSRQAGGAQVIRVGDVARPNGLRTSDLVGGDDFELARAIDAFQASARGASADNVVVVSADQPAYAMPAAAWAAKSGDPILFTERDRVPPATRAAIAAHRQPRIYVLGPPAVIASRVIEDLRRLGTVVRIGAPDPQSNAVAFARYSDGHFGWGAVDPGHGLLFANPGRPGDAAASSALAASGQYAPLLLTAPGGGLTKALSDYLLDIQPGYSGDPARGVYNHGWIVGDDRAVTAGAQSRIDALLEIAPVNQHLTQQP